MVALRHWVQDSLTQMHHDAQQEPLHFAGKAVAVSFGLLMTYFVGLFTYNLFFHPLRSFPGPKLWAMCRIPYTLNHVSGASHFKMVELHKQYGPIVRVAPEVLSISHADGMKQVRGHRKSGKDENGKDPLNFGLQRDNILGAGTENHSRFRRVLSHAFSAQAMQEQEPTFVRYIDQLFDLLRKECEGGAKPLDVVARYNWTTFDIIGDLAFGEPFGCLDDVTYHPWVALIFSTFRHFIWTSNIKRYPWFEWAAQYMVPQEYVRRFKEHWQLSESKVRKRLELGASRPDFMERMTREKGEKEMSFPELVSHAQLLIIAGSETTATLLSTATFFLASHPEALAKLTKEIRSAFNSEHEVDLHSTQHLKYLQAVIEESLRLLPPALAGGPRKIAPAGDTIIGQFVPGDTIVEVWHYAVYRNPEIFTQPDDFIPERWLGDARFKTDRLDAMQAFSTGPRNCIGKNLAYAEARMILTRMFYNFDIKLADKSLNWDMTLKSYGVWEKPPLYVHLTPAQSTKDQ